MGKNNTKEKAFSTISTKSFITVMILLVVILAISGALSYFIPQGSFERIEVSPDVWEIVPGTYTVGEIEGIEI